MSAGAEAAAGPVEEVLAGDVLVNVPAVTLSHVLHSGQISGLPTANSHSVLSDISTFLGAVCVD